MATPRAADPTRDPAEVERLVAIRRERQARLFGDGPPRLWAVINEAVIRRVVGGPTVMREQLARLRELSDLPTVSLQVLPFTRVPIACGGVIAVRAAGPDGLRRGRGSNLT